MSKSGLPSFTVKEVESHNTQESLWIIIDGKVYDVTGFQEEHPGGAEVLQDNAGKDATAAFESVGHTDSAVSLRDSTYLIGTVGPDKQCQGCSDSECKRRAMYIGAVAAGAAAVGVALYFMYRGLKK